MDFHSNTSVTSVILLVYCTIINKKIQKERMYCNTYKVDYFMMVDLLPTFFKKLSDELRALQKCMYCCGSGSDLKLGNSLHINLLYHKRYL